MDKETITTSTPNDNKVYMHTEEEMESIIEGLILIEMGHEIIEKGKAEAYWRTFVAAGVDVVFNTLLDQLAGEDAKRITKKIRARHEAVKDMNPADLFGGLN